MRKILRKMLGLLVCLFVFGAAAVASFAQAGADKILVGGNPPLRQSEVEKSREVFEWLFNARFTDAEQAEYQKYLTAGWRVDRKSFSRLVGEFANLSDEFATADPAQKEKAREMLLPEVVTEMEKDRGGNADSNLMQMLLSIYRNASPRGGADRAATTENDAESNRADAKKSLPVKNNGSTSNGNVQPPRSARAAERPAANRKAAKLPADLTGKWERVGSSSVDYVNRQTGQFISGGGNFFSYEFFPDGHIETYFMFSTNYGGGCETTTTTMRKGHYTVSGNQLKVNFPEVKAGYTQQCNPTGNYKNKPYPAESENSTWRIAREDDGTVRLELTDGKGVTLSFVKSEKQSFKNEEPKQTRESGGDAAEQNLIGAWGQHNLISSYVNKTTGVYAGSTGSSAGYKFYSDGRVEYTSYLEVTNIGCKAQSFYLQKGRYTVDGDALTIKFAPSSVSYKDCRTAYTKPIKAETNSYSWRLTKEYETVRLCLKDSKGSEDCHRRDEQKSVK